ncbi:MAG: hypothetical protein M3R01_03935, partial [Actinomycetota bacterium]|nr:hypothetical protein [Actinomycetota bacterium]
GIGDAVPEPRSYRTAALVTALALAAGAGAVGAAVLDDGRDTTQVVTSALEVPRLVPAVVPPGLGLVRAGELPSPLVASPSGGASLRLYGAPGADDPFARLDLGIVVVPTENPVRARADDRATRSLVVRGQPGLLFEASDATGMRELQWTEPGGPTITLASRSLDDRQVLALAEGLSVEGAAVRPGPLPEGLELVANQPSASVPGRLTVPVPTIAKGWALAYGTPAGASVRRRSLEVATHRGDGDHLAALAWWYDGRTVEVRGHAGVLGTGGDGASVVSWLEDEGVAVTVSAVGFTEEELRGVARTLQRVGPTEWDGLERQAAGPP